MSGMGFEDEEVYRKPLKVRARLDVLLQLMRYR